MADTPLMQQYRSMKMQYAGMILFFRLGDFYEMFDEDAVEVSSLLNLTLTHKGDSPMCGIPFHAVKNYIRRLLDAGKKIAICEQTDLSSKTLAKREVVRIVTPATVVEDDFLDDISSNYILSVFRDCCSYCEVSTGDFHLKNLDRTDRIQSLRSVLHQASPKEILVCEDEYFTDAELKQTVDLFPAMVTKLASWYFSCNSCYSLMCENAGVKSLDGFGISKNNRLCAPAGAMLRYISETSKATVKHLSNYVVDSPDMYVEIDESSGRNLEIFSCLSDGGAKYSLFSTINRCKTAGGTRLFRQWLSFPLKKKDDIFFRQQWVSYFYENSVELERVRSLISSAADMSRLTTRVLQSRCVPHDLTRIKQSIGTFFSIIENNPDKYSSLFESDIDSDSVRQVASLMNEIDRAVNPDFLGQFNEGEVIVEGYDAELDEKRKLKERSDVVLKDYLEQEKLKSGLTILKLGYNRVFGYYLEIPKGQVSKAPDYFIRRQTLVNGERYTTPELQVFEGKILSASEEAGKREKLLYDGLCDIVLSAAEILNAIGRFLSVIDVFQGLATLAVDSSYVRPEITDEDVIHIEQGRHPVVEKQLHTGDFVSNDLDMSVRFSLITGPNMAGKSTYLRQNALIILLAHTGSFVPAKSARIGITDKIFCRVGAMDNLARGQSTFLVEMQETAFILRNCTERSFVIVDEIGRGTSTQDGMSIAYAVMKELIARNVKTLFATHYHELTLIDTSGIRLITLEVEEANGNVKFLRKVKEGVANSSYGIHVAKIAGIPTKVLKTAWDFQNRHFADYGEISQSSLFMQDSDVSHDVSDCNRENIEAYRKIIAELSKTDVDNCTPVQAMFLLSKLKEEAEQI